ncbi:MAG: aminotransferase class I/II-fold pyridoxal phosphate-dependent enzyme [Desulfobacterales bacterium]|nr:aminotransferase class I/II-fold pyridoxal phosphate-dependent enzyme [Desulfobacterales bacterium]
MNPLAEELNEIIENTSADLMAMLSGVGKNLFFPKGILSQGAEAKQKAYRLNATVGIATETGHTMRLDCVASAICDIPPSQSLTYAPSFGIAGLRHAWKAEMFEKNPSLAGKSISLPVVTCGITHAISLFADLFIDPGDVVILPDMFWGNYSLILAVRKEARLCHYNLFSEAGGFDLDAFESRILAEAQQSDKITVLLNFPQNPSGYSVTEAEGDRIVEILARVAEAGTRVLVVTDDAYFGLFYAAETLKESLFARLCDRHPRLLAVKLDGATKEHYVWGLRVGFITYGIAVDADAEAVYDALERKTAGAVRGNISNASHLGQSIILRSMQSPDYEKEKTAKFAIMKQRAERVRQVLADPKYAGAWDVYPFNSGYFMCLRLKTVDAERLRVHLLDHYGVGLIAMGAHNLRVAFSCLEQSDIQMLFDTVLQGVLDLET